MSEVDDLAAVIEGLDGDRTLTAAALAQALLAEGYALVQLPKPDGVDDDGQLLFDGGNYRVDLTSTSGEWPVLYIDGIPYEPAAIVSDAGTRIAAGRAALEVQPAQRGER
ncbi:hypothetical protein [Tsukamurella hominis]|uniref:hypothetical protein n=1 Tax=Tsukamurella hominis TaxID=1970232 RepID=UPI0039EA6E52